MRIIIDFLRPFSFRGKSRLMNPIVPQCGVVHANIYGYKMKLDLKDHIQRMIYIGAFERLETSLIKSYLRPGATFADVGANVGYFSLLASRLVGKTGRVLSFEPSSYVANLLSETIQVNSIQTIDLCRYALGRVNSKAVLSDVLPSNHSPTFFLPGSGPPVDIRVLDEVLAEKNIDRIDLMKIDVEGFELEVLSGAEKTVSEGKIRSILVEFNAHWLSKAGTSSRALHEWLTNRSFRCLASDDAPTEALSNRLYVRK